MANTTKKTTKTTEEKEVETTKTVEEKESKVLKLGGGIIL